MRVLKFDRDEAAALTALGFKIKDGDAATVAGEMTVALIRPEKSDALWIEITLPNGTVLNTKTERAALLQAANADE